MLRKHFSNQNTYTHTPKRDHQKQTLKLRINFVFKSVNKILDQMKTSFSSFPQTICFNESPTTQCHEIKTLTENGIAVSDVDGNCVNACIYPFRNVVGKLMNFGRTTSHRSGASERASNVHIYINIYILIVEKAFCKYLFVSTNTNRNSFIVQFYLNENTQKQKTKCKSPNETQLSDKRMRQSISPPIHAENIHL